MDMNIRPKSGFAVRMAEGAKRGVDAFDGTRLPPEAKSAAVNKVNLPPCV